MRASSSPNASNTAMPAIATRRWKRWSSRSWSFSSARRIALQRPRFLRLDRMSLRNEQQEAHQRPQYSADHGPDQDLPAGQLGARSQANQNRHALAEQQ